MSSRIRNIPYGLAINEALRQAMASDPSVMLIGQGVKSPWYVGGTCGGLLEKFGPGRVIDTPVSENAVTGAAVGAAIAGMKTIVVHPRMDFMLLAFDPIVNEAANWHYMSGGRSSVPVVFWGIVNRGGEQAAQHSQALHALFAHVPGLKVAAPSTAYDAKGLLVSAIFDPNPVVFVDDRWLYNTEGAVPEKMYRVPFGRGVVRKEGRHITLAAASYSAVESLKAAGILKGEGIDAEVLDLRTIKPLDEDLLFGSVKKTGRLVVADGGWKTCGLGAEICALAAERVFRYLKAPVARVTLPDVPAPASRRLEEVYYPAAPDIVLAARKAMNA